MARGVKVKLDSKGVGELLAGGEVARMVRASGGRVASAAGSGFEADTWISPVRGMSARGNSYPPRVVSGVVAVSTAARIRQSRDQVLQRARDAGRT